MICQVVPNLVRIQARKAILVILSDVWSHDCHVIMLSEASRVRHGTGLLVKGDILSFEKVIRELHPALTWDGQIENFGSLPNLTQVAQTEHPYLRASQGKSLKLRQ
jgi:hypothetical protein